MVQKYRAWEPYHSLTKPTMEKKLKYNFVKAAISFLTRSQIIFEKIVAVNREIDAIESEFIGCMEQEIMEMKHIRDQAMENLQVSVRAVREVHDNSSRETVNKS